MFTFALFTFRCILIAQVLFAQLVYKILILLYLQFLQIFKSLLLIDKFIYLADNFLARRCLFKRRYPPRQLRQLDRPFSSLLALTFGAIAHAIIPLMISRRHPVIRNDDWQFTLPSLIFCGGVIHAVPVLLKIRQGHALWKLWVGCSPCRDRLPLASSKANLLPLQR